MALRPKSGIHQIKAHMLVNDLEAFPPPRILLNSNESAFGPCQSAIDAAAATAKDLFRYLENPLSRLGPALAMRHGLEPTRIALGNGSDDLLARLARVYLESGNEMIRSRNGYLKTPNYAHANNALPISVEDIEFTTSVDAILAAVTDQTRMVYVANPENPAGTYLSGKEIRRLHHHLPDHVILVLDCAYEEYVDAEDYEAGHVLASETKNVVVTRTFSKIYGLAGARIGWMYGDEEIVDMVSRIGLTFPLSSPAVAAAEAALADENHISRIYKINCGLRQRFSRRMQALGLKVYPSQTNFVLVEFSSGQFSATNCAQYLSHQGIAVRRFASPAYENCIRVTIGIEADLQCAENAIATFLRLP
jgi:histidinol-phosphate aminotransferase